MRLYDKQSTYCVLGGSVFMHLLVAGICIHSSYTWPITPDDPGTLLLIAFFIVLMIVWDIMLCKTQTYSRFLTRFKADSEGIHCRLGLKKWNVLWNDIHVYGIIGFSAWTGMGIIFLSTDADEKHIPKKCVSISEKRIVFQAEERIWSEISTYMPNDIKSKLRRSIDNKQDCYYRR